MEDSEKFLRAVGDIQLILAFQVAPVLVKKYGLDLKLYHVLKRIADGAVYPGDIAKVSFESPSRVSRRLDKLEALGLVRRVLDRLDTRKIRIELSSYAPDLISKLDAEFIARLAPAFAKIPAADRSSAVDVLESVYAGLLPPGCAKVSTSVD